MYIIVDDERSLDEVRKLVKLPVTKDGPVWDICRSYNGFIKLLESLDKPPVFISFDHDLGDIPPKNGHTEMTGVNCARALIEIAIIKKWPYLPKIVVHSQNPVGRDNIKATITTFERWVGIKGVDANPTNKRR
jgi:hypothetical protein